MSASYEEFLTGKAQVAVETGIPDLDPDLIHPALQPHQRDAVAWAIRGGRRALFESFGLGKTIQQKLGRTGIGVELNGDYWRDGVHHLQGIARDQAAPTLFDLADQDGAA